MSIFWRETVFVKLQFIRFRWACRSRLEKLSDKGERIKSLHIRIVEEIESRKELDQAATVFSDLNIAVKGLKAIMQMEWNGGKTNGDENVASADSDDDLDEENKLLKMLARSRVQTKIVQVEKPEPSLVTAADLEEIKSFDVQLEPHALYVAGKDKIVDENSNVKTKKFYPHKTTTSDVHSVEKEKSRPHGKHWEVTAATPPTLRNSEAKMLTLKESIEIERKQKEDSKKFLEQQAMERLALRQKLISENIELLAPNIDTTDPNKLFQSYREKVDDSDEESFSENSDDGEEPETGGVSVVTYD